MPNRLDKGEERGGEGSGDARLLNPDQTVACANGHGVFDLKRQANPRTQIALLQIAGGSRKSVLSQEIQPLSIQIEHRPAIATHGRWKIQRVPHSKVQRQPSRRPPVVSKENLRHCGPGLQLLRLRVERESSHLAQKKRRIAVPGVCHGRALCR
ncbi:MAG TPA: hypothetical protein VM120_25240 [Bryobacteraceae bacterium]|nr:hypothetical protein [Bryobacteraceae bacterium]